jgi:hypothetical protein
MAQIKQIVINSGLVLFSCTIILVGAEFFLQHTAYVGLISAGGEPPDYYVNSDAGYDIRPNFSTTTHRFADSAYDVWSNNLGCFDYPYAEGRNMLVIGDSFAWGYTPFADKWGTLLEKYLEERVLKCGVSGYGTKQEYMKAVETLKKVDRPDMIIVEHFVNDIGDDKNFVATQNASTTKEERAATVEQTQALANIYCMPSMPTHPIVQRIKCYFRKNSVLYLLTRDALQTLTSKKFSWIAGIHDSAPFVPTREDMLLHKNTILDFKRLGTTRGIPLLFVVVPSKETVQETTSTNLENEASPEVQNHAVIQYLRDNKIDHIDALPEMRAIEHATSSSLFWRFDGHLSPTGNHFLALIIAKHILEKKGLSPALEHVREQLRYEFSYPIQN